MNYTPDLVRQTTDERSPSKCPAIRQPDTSAKLGQAPPLRAAARSQAGSGFRSYPAAATALHRRLDAVLLGVKPIRGQAAIRMLQRDDEDRDPRLQQADVARGRGQHRHVGSNAVFGLAAL